MLYALLAVIAAFVIVGAVAFVPQAYQGVKEDLVQRGWRALPRLFLAVLLWAGLGLVVYVLAEAFAFYFVP